MTLTTLDPKTALVLIDLQRGVVGMSTAPFSGPDVVARSAELAGAFRAAALPVVLVNVSFGADGAAATPGRTEATGRGLQRPADWDVLVGEIATHDSDIRVTKRNWGAFYGTDLDLQLRRRGVTQIVLGGIATSAGVESTARAAHEHGYHVTFATDAMSDLAAHAHHHSIEWIFPRIGELGTTSDVLKLLASTHSF